jgi:hypothetical protein
MIFTKALVLSLLLWLFNFRASAQIIRGQYLVLMFEDMYKNSPHKTDTYYWIISADSLKQHKRVSPLLLSGFSKTTLESCCKGDIIDPYVVTATTSYSFAESYFASTDSLRQLIFRNRIRIQNVSKKWKSGQRETLQIFATPIQGTFCSSNYAIQPPGINEYSGRIYFPVSGFHYVNDFWINVPINLIEQDFAAINFSVFQNLSRRP